MSINSSVTPRSQRVQNPIRFILGAAVGGVGLANMVSILIPRPNWDLVLGAWTGDTLHGASRLMIVVGFFLLMLTLGIVRGKRQAWLITILLLLLSAVLQVVSKGLVFITLATTLLAGTIVLCARCFQAKSDPPSIRRGYLALITGLGIVTLYAIGGFVLLYQQFEPLFDRFGFEPTIVHVLTHSHILQLISGTQAMVFGRALPILCVCAILYGIAQILHPVAAVLLPNEEELNHATQLTRTYGKNSISYFALSREKSFFFSASGKSCISYVLEGSTAVVAGDPIGPEEEMLPTLQQFMRFCHDQDWTVVFWQIRESLLDLYRTVGLHQMKIGEDAIIDTSTFTLAGKAMSNVRSSAKRAEKEGMRIVFLQGSKQNTGHLSQMEHISHTWLANKGGSEKGFSMGRFEKRGDAEQVYALAIDASDTVQAFVTFIPIYGRNGWGLDLMRRVEQTTPGTMELLLSRSILYIKERGADVVSLGLAPLSHSNPSDENLLESSIDFLTHRFGDPNKQQSLFTFKKKFQPTWESRYLVYSNTLQLPAVGWALYHAHQHDMTILTFLYHTLKEWRQRAQTTREHVTAVARAVTGSLTL